MSGIDRVTELMGSGLVFCWLCTVQDLTPIQVDPDTGFTLRLFRARNRLSVKLVSEQK